MDDVEFVSTIEDITVSGHTMSYLSEKVFIPFEYNDRDTSSLCVILTLTSIILIILTRFLQAVIIILSHPLKNMWTNVLVP